MKLFGNCKFFDECTCGRCAEAAINQVDQIKVTKPDGTVEFQQAPASREANEYSDWKKSPSQKTKPQIRSTYPTCEACGKRLMARRNHRCLNPGAVPPPQTLPTEVLEQTTIIETPVTDKPQLPKRCKTIDNLPCAVTIKLAGVEITIKPLEAV